MVYGVASTHRAEGRRKASARSSSFSERATTAVGVTGKKSTAERKRAGARCSSFSERAHDLRVTHRNESRSALNLDVSTPAFLRIR